MPAKLLSCGNGVSTKEETKKYLGHTIYRLISEPRSVRIVWNDGDATTMEWECLPDTIDPRGPKGGGR